MRTVTVVCIGALVGFCPAGASAQAPAPESSVSISAPRQVAPGKRFTVRMKITLAGPDQAFVTGGFLDYLGTHPVPSKRKCPATPQGTFAGDTPQIPQPPGVNESTVRTRNRVKRTGILRCAAPTRGTPHRSTSRSSSGSRTARSAVSSTRRTSTAATA